MDLQKRSRIAAAAIRTSIATLQLIALRDLAQDRLGDMPAPAGFGARRFCSTAALWIWCHCFRLQVPAWSPPSLGFREALPLDLLERYIER